jgi:hypothetical protein
MNEADEKVEKLKTVLDHMRPIILRVETSMGTGFMSVYTRVIFFGGTRLKEGLNVGKVRGGSRG